jgi:aspartyl-tRNA(Asn)/glutamyl-tRNA(Gln) amidotransferase subunit A
MGRELRESIMAGSAARAVDYVAAQRRRRELAHATDALIRGFDVLLLPCACHTAPSFDDPKAVLAFMSDSATTPFSLSGHPALAMRTGFDEAGLPIGVQLVGRYFDEAMVLRAARAYERARTWHRRRPRL